MSTENKKPSLTVLILNWVVLFAIIFWMTILALGVSGCASGIEMGRYMEMQDQFRARTEKDLRIIIKAHNRVANDVRKLEAWQGNVNETLEGFKAEEEEKAAEKIQEEKTDQETEQVRSSSG